MLFENSFCALTVRIILLSKNKINTKLFLPSVLESEKAAKASPSNINQALDSFHGDRQM